MASGGLDIWVSSTCFQKINISWPQQPPTEKVLKLNMTFHDSTKKIFFQNIKIRQNSRIWITLKSSVVIFQSLEHLQPQWPEQPLFIKNFTDPDSWIIPGTQMTNTGHFLWNGSSEFHFVIDIVYPFCRRMLRPMLPVWLRDTEKVMVHWIPMLKSKS